MAKWATSPFPSGPALSLAEVLSKNPVGPFHGPPEALGRDLAGPFRGAGWQTTTVHSTHLEWKGPRGDLQFALTQVRPLRLELEGKGPGSKSCHWSLNDHPLPPLRMGEDWKRDGWSVPEEFLLVGLNRLSLSDGEATCWRSLCESDASEGEEIPEGVGVPIDHLREAALTVQPGSRLRWGGVEAWLAPGAPPLDLEGWKLEVQLSSGRENWSRKWEVPCLPGPGILPLALSSHGTGALTISVRSPQGQKALPGQRGVVLLRPEMEGGAWDQPRPLGPAELAPSQKPGLILLYVIDTLRADHLHCYGYPGATSPCLDAFARDAVLFRNARAQASWTKPATATLLTGLDPALHHANDFADLLDPSISTLAERLRGLGYQTRAVVTNPFVSQAFGFDQGFETFHYLPLGLSAQVTQKAVEGLGSGPQFLYLHTLDPHSPYAPPPEFRPDSPRRSMEDEDLLELGRQLQQGRLEPARARERIREVMSFYDAEIRSNDRSLGDLLAVLKERGLYDQSLIVVVSDHGEEFYEHGGFGHISSLHRELLHIPLLIKFPGQRWGGTVAEGNWQQVDVAPTILAELGETQTGEGRAFHPKLDEQARERAAFYSLCAGQEAERFDQGKNRMLVMDGVEWRGWSLQRTLASRAEFRQPMELYHLQEDPGEAHNRVYEMPEVRLLLQQLLLGRTPVRPGPQADPDQVRNSLKSLQYVR